MTQLYFFRKQSGIMLDASWYLLSPSDTFIDLDKYDKFVLEVKTLYESVMKLAGMYGYLRPVSRTTESLTLEIGYSNGNGGKSERLIEKYLDECKGTLGLDWDTPLFVSAFNKCI